MKMALSFSIASSWPGLDLYQTSTFSELLTLAEAQFDLFITSDHGLAYQEAEGSACILLAETE
jgi:hypothetical protein